jgi:glycosyltransferase involved in cell wall biosynthesis
MFKECSWHAYLSFAPGPIFFTTNLAFMATERPVWAVPWLQIKANRVVNLCSMAPTIRASTTLRPTARTVRLEQRHPSSRDPTRLMNSLAPSSCPRVVLHSRAPPRPRAFRLARATATKRELEIDNAIAPNNANSRARAATSLLDCAAVRSPRRFMGRWGLRKSLALGIAKLLGNVSARKLCGRMCLARGCNDHLDAVVALNSGRSEAMAMTAGAMDMVSVVIPSRNRPGLVARAVQSALNQTLQSVEVIVVVDGPDEATRQALGQIGDPRLRVVNLEKSVGAQEARNIGVREAQGPWIAFLDDDDEWLPAKLERQLEAARASRWPHPLVSCGLIARTPEGDTEWPRRKPVESEPVAEYLFFRRISEISEIRLQTSTLMTTKALLTRVPWRTGLHDEWDLLLRAAAVEGVGLVFAPGPLAIWHSDSGTERLSRSGMSWRHCGAWFHSVRALVGPRPYASFLLSVMSTWARNEQDWGAFFYIPWEATRHGRPTLSGLLGHTGRWLLPRPLRDFLKQLRRPHPESAVGRY